MTLHGACPEGHHCHPRPHLARLPLDSSMPNFYFPASDSAHKHPESDAGHREDGVRVSVVCPVPPGAAQEDPDGHCGPGPRFAARAPPGCAWTCRATGTTRSPSCVQARRQVGSQVPAVPRSRPTFPSPTPIHASKWPKPLKRDQLLELPLSSILQGPPSCPELNP